MKLHPIKPRKALNKAYLKVKPIRSDMERFKVELIQILDRTKVEKHLVSTKPCAWFISNVTGFECLFAQNTALVKQFGDFEAGRLADSSNFNVQEIILRDGI